VSDWQPIETAPKDQTIDLWGTRRGLMMPPERVTNCRWDYVNKNGVLVMSEWVKGNGTIIDPTHWMPIPSPPI